MDTNFMNMDVLRCDGRTAESVRKLGDVLGHVTPGVALAGWGLHCFIGACWRHALAERDPSAPRFFGRTWEPVLPFLPWPLWRKFNRVVPVDPLYKALMGGLLVLFAFPFQQIVCPDGVRLGRIVGQHIVRWAHSTLLSSYALLGFVELLSFRVRFPAHTSTATMIVTHSVCAVIFLYHQKHEVLDQMAHGLLGYCFIAAAACGVMELANPSSFLAVCGKLYSHILGGLWLAIVGHIIFGEHLFWSPVWDGQSDVGPAMFVPVVFGLTMLGLCAFLLLTYAAIDLLAAWRLRCSPSAAHDNLDGDEPMGLSFPHLPVRRVGEEGQGLLAARGRERDGEEPGATATLGDIQLGCGVGCGGDADGCRPANRKAAFPRV